MAPLLRAISRSISHDSMSRLLLKLSNFLEQTLEGGQRQDECSFRIDERHSAVTDVPGGGSVILGVDDEDRAANDRRRHQAAPSGREQQLSAKALPLLRTIDGNAREPKAGNLMTGRAALHDPWCPVIGKRGRGQTVESKNGARDVIDRQKSLCRALVVALARVADQEDVQLRLATVEGAAIVLPCNSFFVPRRNRHAPEPSRKPRHGDGGSA